MVDLEARFRDAYTRLGMNDLADDARRVLALNIEQGTLVPETTDETDDSLIEQLWNYLELDKS